MLKRDMGRWAQSSGEAPPEYARYWEDLVFLCPTQNNPINLIDGTKPVTYNSGYRTATHYGRGYTIGSGDIAVSSFPKTAAWEPDVNNACTFVIFTEWTGDPVTYTECIGDFNNYVRGVQIAGTTISMRLKFATAGYVNADWYSLGSYYNTPLMFVGRWKYGESLTLKVFNAKTGVLLSSGASVTVSETPQIDANGWSLWGHRTATAAVGKYFGYAAAWTRRLTDNEVYLLAQNSTAPFRYSSRTSRRATPLYSAINETVTGDVDNIQLISGSSAYKAQLGSVNRPPADSGAVTIELDTQWTG